MAASSLMFKLALVCIVLYALKLCLAPRKTPTPLPPGPKPLPIVGNIRDLPPAGAREWEHWQKHKALYGPISSVTVFGTTIVILSDANLAFELMEKRGAKYSSRPGMLFANQMCGWRHILVSQQYSERFRRMRRSLHKAIGTKSALAKFYPLQDTEVSRFLLRVIEEPEALTQHIRTEAGAIILKVAYGYTVNPHKEDPLVDLANSALSQFFAAAVPGAWLVDTIPALRYLPEWLPGMSFKKVAREWHATLMEVADRPMRFVKQQKDAGENEPSFAADLMDEAGKDADQDEVYITKWSAASLYTGGADTSVSTMITFFLAMVIAPEVQKRAQEEIDRVVGTHRLPTFDDREHLPYVEAVLQEAYRWHPIAPMGIPHVTNEDDICNGYFIPKGAMIVPNIWLYTHDPDVYPEPMAFKPERFLVSPPPPDPRDYVFGFGRRVCPGKLLADCSVWLTVAKSLAALDIRNGVDANGDLVTPKVEFSPGVVSHATPFKANIRPRNEHYESLIRNVEKEHPWEEGSAEIETATLSNRS